MASSEQQVSVGGHRIRLTNLEKVLYPETGTTKANVLDYFARISDALLPHSKDRPATRKRWVHGVGTAEEPGAVFFQKNLDDSTPTWVRRRSIQHKDHANDYPLVNDVATLTWLGQIAALEIHVPQWRFGRTGVQKNPDRMVLDLDPGEGAGLAECAEVARIARAILQGMGLEPLPVTSGSKGMHLYTPIDGRQSSDDISAVSHELARVIEADHPDLAVSDMKKSIRGGKVLVDWSQNNANKTTIAPYSLRGRLHPTVAAPRTWDELDSPDLAQLEYTDVLARFEEMGDLLAPLTENQLASLEPTKERMAHFLRADDRLATYRSKRSAEKTPEPVPADAPAPTTGQGFVIHEHHARRLHWDLRLEHEGVLVSWALPKGVPTDGDTNHLAVQTEDHPLEYGDFEGDIPEGEYGAGRIEIWDAGSYELEKWREDEEVIVTLHGERHGSHRFALIHTGKTPEEANHWLIHLMADAANQPARKGPRGSTARGATVRTGARSHGGDSPASLALSKGPMLATLGSERDISGDGWAFEMKWDGIRALAVVRTGEVRFVSRAGNDLTASYPELAVLADAVEGDAILDGEIVAFDDTGRPRFERLQKRMGLTKPRDVDAARKRISVSYLVFDVLERGAESLIDESYDARRAVLDELVTPAERILVPPAVEDDAAGAMATSRQLGLEGLVAKRRDSSYSIGRRGRAWLKLKHHSAQEVVIGGWLPGKGARSGAVGALLLGIPGDGGLRFVGRVGTGFSEKELEKITTRLRGLERTTSPFLELPRADADGAHFVTPSLVGEVQFSEWTTAGKLRHPSWRGWRTDKSADEVVREG